MSGEDYRCLWERGLTTKDVRRAAKAICRERYGPRVWFVNREERDYSMVLALVALRAALRDEEADHGQASEVV